VKLPRPKILTGKKQNMSLILKFSFWGAVVFMILVMITAVISSMKQSEPVQASIITHQEASRAETLNHSP
jgi:preprotein translocase subunit SecG